MKEFLCLQKAKLNALGRLFQKKKKKKDKRQHRVPIGGSLAEKSSQQINILLNVSYER